MARIARVLIAVAAAALAVPALAHAEERTLTFTTAAISVAATASPSSRCSPQSPSVDGYVVGMEAEVVDAAGKVQGRDKVMLHHIVFAKIGVPDYTCGGFTERFFAEGEERLALSLPRGYGYANKATDRWGLLYMLMNHKPQRLNGFIRYTVRYVTGEALTPVKTGLARRPQLHGRHRPRLRRSRRRQALLDLHEDRPTSRCPESGRLISGGGHLHGGGVRLELRNATCGTVPFESRPTWGGPKPKPLLHEPGPTKMSVVPLDRGDPGREGAEAAARRGLRQPGAAHARDGDHAALPRAGSREGLRRDAALDIDLGNPSAPPPFSMPLPRAPKGPVSTAKSTFVGDFRYGIERDLAQARHDVHVAVRGPVPARRHGGRRPRRLLGAVDADGRLQAPLHEGRHLSPVLLAPPGEDGAADSQVCVRPSELRSRRTRLTSPRDHGCEGRARSGRRRRGRGR